MNNNCWKVTPFGVFWFFPRAAGPIFCAVLSWLYWLSADCQWILCGFSADSQLIINESNNNNKYISIFKPIKDDGQEIVRTKVSKMPFKFNDKSEVYVRKKSSPSFAIHQEVSRPAAPPLLLKFWKFTTKHQQFLKFHHQICKNLHWIYVTISINMAWCCCTLLLLWEALKLR